jgi:hypothetical protein
MSAAPPLPRSITLGLPVATGVALLLFYLLTFPGAIAPKSSDGRAMYLVTRALVDRRAVAIQPAVRGLVAVVPGWRSVPAPTQGPCPTEPAVIGLGQRASGPFYSKYGLGQSLAAAPLYLAGRTTAGMLPRDVRDEAAALVTSAFDALVTALTAALLCALGLRLRWSPPVALALTLLYGLATPAWPYTTTFFSEPLQGLCLLAALAAVLWQPDVPSIGAATLAGLALGLAMLTHQGDSALYVPAFALFLVARGQGRPALPLLAGLGLPVLVALAISGLYNLARFGSVLTTGYGLAGDLHDLHPPRTLQGLWEGVYGPLFSPGKGLAWYAPVLLLAVWALVRFGRRDRLGACLIAGLAGIAVLAHADTLIVWLGGWAWGPRFLVPVLPLLILPLGCLLEGAGARVRRLAWALGMLGALLQIPAILLDKGAYIGYLARQQGCVWKAENLYKWNPGYSPLIGQWQRLFDGATYAARTRPGQGATAFSIANGMFVPEPQAWWSLLASQGVTWPVLAGICMGLALLSAGAFGLALRLSR